MMTSESTAKSVQNDAIGTSSGSQVSVGFPDLRSASQLSQGSGAASNNNAAVRHDLPEKSILRDTCCLVLFCVRHERILLCLVPGRGLYFPILAMRPTETWQTTMEKIIANLPLNGLAVPIIRSEGRVGNSVGVNRNFLVDLFAVQTPSNFPHFFTRVTYAIRIAPDSTCCCDQSNDASKGGHVWLTLEEIKARSDTLVGPEAYTIGCAVLKKYKRVLKDSHNVNEVEDRLGVTVTEMDTSDATNLLLSTSGKHLAKKELLLSARYTEEEVLKMFNEFVAQCFPSRYMTFMPFRSFMLKLGWLAEEETMLKCIFGAFAASSPYSDRRPLPYLAFDDLLIGLATMDESADHRGNCLRLRLKLMFHFYDLDRDKKLSSKELPKLAFDIVSKRSSIGANHRDESRSNEVLLREVSEQRRRENQVCEDSFILVAEMFRRIANLSTTDESLLARSSISLQQLIDCVDSFHGAWLAELTEPIFRSNICAAEVASSKFAYRPVFGKMSMLKAQISLTRYDEPCERCRAERRYHLCVHAIRVDVLGRIIGTIKFDLCPAHHDVSFRQELTISESLFNCALHFVRYVSTLAIGPSLRPDQPNLRELLQLTKEIVANEPLVVRRCSPCYVVPEVHANLKTLYKLVAYIDGWMPFVQPANLLFMGNFAEPSSAFGLDTVLYLFCLKALSPKRIVLLRGPMECRATFMKTKLQRDCLELYGDACWTLLCDIVELLPLAAIVDDRIFLTKFGIPAKCDRPIGQITALNPPIPKTPISHIDSIRILDGQLRRAKKMASHEKAVMIKSATPHGTKTDHRTNHKHQRIRSSSSSSPPTIKMIGNCNTNNNTTTAGGGGGGGGKTKSSKTAKIKTLVKKKVKKRSATKQSGKTIISNGSSSTSSVSQSSSSPSCYISPLGKNKTSSAGMVHSSTAIGVTGNTPRQLQRFLRLNQLSHVIRSEMLPVGVCSKPFRVSHCATLITLGGIGSQPIKCHGAGRRNGNDSGTIDKLNGAIALLDGIKIRLIRLEAILGARRFF